jgi:hypothetical protein
VRWFCALLVALPFVTGCESAGTTSGDDCTSHYVLVADARTRADLLRELRENVDPRVRTLRLIDEHPDPGKVYVNLVSGRQRLVMSLDMWQRPDGAWTARQWSQCID